MNCENVRSLIDPLTDNELSTETVAQVMQHLDGCADCQDAWSGRVLLRDRFRVFGSSIDLPDGALERLDQKIDQEANGFRLRSVNPQRKLMGAVAAAVLLVMGVCTMVFTNSRPVVTAQQIAADYSQSKTIVEPTGITKAQLDKVSQSVGFKIQPHSFSGWKLVSADIYNSSNQKICLARLTYQNEKDGKPQSLTLYQGCSGDFRPSGLQEHIVAGRSVCCGKLGDLAIVYWLDKKMDHILVGSMTEKQLMSMALSV